MPIITASETVVLNAARTTLLEVEERLTGARSYKSGRCAEACEVAENAIFNALNCIACYLHDDVANQSLHASRVCVAEVIELKGQADA